MKYSGTHAALSCFSITPGTEYSLMSDIKCRIEKDVTEEVKTTTNLYNVDSAKAESAVAAGCAYTADKEKATETSAVVYVDDVDYAADATVAATIETTTTQVTGTEKVKLQGYTLDRDNYLKTAIDEGVAFDINGEVTEKEDEAFVTSNKEYAVKA